MRVSIIVRDSTVYLDGVPVQITMTESCKNLKAVQWGENGTESGHIELLDGTNISIDAQGFAAFDDVVSAAQKALAAQAAPGFSVDRQRVGEFNVFKVAASEAGATTVAGDQRDVKRDTSSIRVSMVTRGARQYSSAKSAFAPITLSVGDFNLDLPDMEADDTYIVTALTEDTEYYCVSRSDLAPFEFQRFSVSAGGNVVVPIGKHAFIGGGVVSGEASPRLVMPANEERRLSVDEGTAFGILF